MNFQHFTIQTINWFVSKAPLLFSKKWCSLPRSSLKIKSKKITMKKYEVIKTYSFLDPRLNWKLKAISSVCTIPALQVNKLISGKKIQTYIDFGSTTRLRLMTKAYSILVTSQPVKPKLRCHFSWSKPDLVTSAMFTWLDVLNGTYYLSMYWYLSDKATSLVKDIDISELENTKVKYFYM